MSRVTLGIMAARFPTFSRCRNDHRRTARAQPVRNPVRSNVSTADRHDWRLGVFGLLVRYPAGFSMPRGVDGHLQML